jgi:hypothetical protein
MRGDGVGPQFDGIKKLEKLEIEMARGQRPEDRSNTEGDKESGYKPINTFVAR